MKRRIKSHKGGRTALVFGNVKVTPEEKELILSAQLSANLRNADFLIAMAKLYWQSKQQPETTARNNSQKQQPETTKPTAS